MPDEEIVARATEIHGRLLTIDTHADIPPTFATDEVDPGAPDGRQVTLPQMRAGGLDAAFFIVYVGQTERTEENYAAAKADALVKFAAIHRMADTLYPAEIELAYSAADVIRIHDSGKLVAAIGIENGYVIGKRPDVARAVPRVGGALHHTGTRWSQRHFRFVHTEGPPQRRPGRARWHQRVR